MVATTTVGTVPVPHPKQIRDLLGDLVGREVTVGLGNPVLPGPYTPAAVAVYVTDKTATGAVAVCDLPLAAWAGAALAMIPVGQAEEAVAAGSLPTDLGENFYEVVNILASVFNEEPGAPHLKLYKVHEAGERLPGDIAAFVAQVPRRLDLDVEIAGYGKGRISVIAAL